MIDFKQVEKKIQVGGERGFYLLGKDEISYEVVGSQILLKLALMDTVTQFAYEPTRFSFEGVTCISISDFQSKASLFDTATGGGSAPTGSLQSFDSNAHAVAAIGVGKMYKSTTLVNGSPIILITA